MTSIRHDGHPLCQRIGFDQEEEGQRPQEAAKDDRQQARARVVHLLMFHLFAPHSIYFRTLSLKMGKKRAEPNPNTHSPKPEQQQLKLMLTAALADAIGENEIVNRIVYAAEE